METALQKQDGLKCALTVTLPAEVYQEKYEKILSKESQKAKLDGFRKGKAPKNVVAQTFAEVLFDKTVNELVNVSLPEAFKKEAVRPVNTPTLVDIKVNKNEPFSYTVNFEVAPTIEKIHFDNTEIQKIEAEISEADITTAIDNILKQFGTWVVKDDAAALQDRLALDFAGSIEGVPFEGGSAQNQTLVLGEGRMIPGFEEQIVGMKTGEEKTITVTFPQDYAADLAGKEAQFKITVHKIETLKQAEINAELIQRLGVASGELADLQSEIKKTLMRELKMLVKQSLQTEIFTKLTEQNPLTLPESVVHDEVHVLMDQAKARLQKMFGNKKMPNMDLPHELFEGEAKQRVLLSYLLLKIVEDNDIKADPEAVQALAEEWAAAYENPTQVRDYYLRTPEQLKHLENAVIENAALDYLLSKARVNVVKKTYAELTKEKRNTSEK